jgi:hypothetical protein
MNSRPSNVEMSEDTQEFFMREWNQRHQSYQRSESHRLSMRAVEKVQKEFTDRGFAGFTVRQGPDGYLLIEGLPR